MTKTSNNTPVVVLVVDADRQRRRTLARTLRRRVDGQPAAFRVRSCPDASSPPRQMPAGGYVTVLGAEAGDAAVATTVETLVATERGPVIVLVDHGGDSDETLLAAGAHDVLPRALVDADVTILVRSVDETARRIAAGLPARPRGARWRRRVGALADEVARLGSAVRTVGPVVEATSMVFRPALEAAVKFPMVVRDRMAEPPTAEQAALLAQLAEPVAATGPLAAEIVEALEAPTESVLAPIGLEIETVPAPGTTLTDLADAMPPALPAAGEATASTPALLETKGVVAPAGEVVAASLDLLEDLGLPRIQLTPQARRARVVSRADRMEREVQRHVERLMRLYGQPDELALVEFELRDSDASVETMRRFLLREARPQDLWLDPHDGRSLVALHPAPDAAPWIGRLQSAWWTSIIDGSADERSAFDARCLAAWPCPPSRELLEAFAEHRELDPVACAA
ncbi:MAG: hypothetical protein ACYTG1_03735 [Planctomycetota bacterium]|jgi:hypothetical protein